MYVENRTKTEKNETTRVFISTSFVLLRLVGTRYLERLLYVGDRTTSEAFLVSSTQASRGKSKTLH